MQGMFIGLVHWLVCSGLCIFGNQHAVTCDIHSTGSEIKYWFAMLTAKLK